MNQIYRCSRCARWRNVPSILADLLAPACQCPPVTNVYRLRNGTLEQLGADEVEALRQLPADEMCVLAAYENQAAIESRMD